MKKTVITLSLVFVYLLSVASCDGKPKLENDTARFKDYVYLEDSLTMVMSFPSKSFSSLYEKFRLDYGWNGDISGIKDGTYESYSTLDLRGYVHYVRFTLANGAFTSVYYDEFKPGDSFGKRTDEAYGKTISRTKPDILGKAYPQLEAGLIATQNPVAVDTVSGATLASYRFQLALLKAVYEISSKRILNTERYTQAPVQHD